MMESELAERILAHVGQPEYRPVKPRLIARQMAAAAEEEEQIRKTIKRLIREGRLAYGDKHRVFPLLPGSPTPEPSADASTLVTGTFRRTSGGFGFVRPLHAGPDEEDIYVSRRGSGDAASGDRVQVQLGRPRRRGPTLRKAGEIVAILQRAARQFVGTYQQRRGRGLVQVDGTIFAQPIDVGDPGAKGALPGDKVVIEIVRYPSEADDGEAVITELLGQRGEPEFDTRLILRQYDLPDRFPASVLDAAREQVARFDGSIGPDRSDLTRSCVITIDPVDARDFDDAISLEQLDGGHWRLGVHIADVSHFVPFRSPLDIEARERGTSVYLPDHVIPMLPELISNNLASLQPDKVRYTKTIFIEFTAEGIPVATEWCAAAIRSARRFTYEEVDAYLQDHETWQTKLSPEVFHLLDRMAQLARILRRRRMRRGALELTLPEIKLELNRDKQVQRFYKVENTESHQMIEEFMLAANEAVATRLRDLEILFLRRVHPNPDPRKMRQLTEFVRDLGFDVENLENRFELRELLAKVQGRPEEYAVNFAALRSLAKAEYSPIDEGHYALASDCYCHFTSPIRRYPDLTVHRLLDYVFRGRRPVAQFAQLSDLGRHCSEREQRAEVAERELIKLKLLGYLQQRIGQTIHGVITGVEDYGLFVQGIEIPAEGLIHISSLNEDRYAYDARAHTLRGHREGNQFRLGDLVEIEVARVDLDRRQLDFKLKAHQPRGKRVVPRRSSRPRKHPIKPQRRGKRGRRGGRRGPP